MTRLANAQADRPKSRVGRDLGMQLAQPFKGVGLQAGEEGIHLCIIEGNPVGAVAANHYTLSHGY
jgi:hypothetical protein